MAMPHPVWGETPCAFVVLKKGESSEGDGEDKLVTKEAYLIEYCRENLPHFMCPRKVVFLEELPKNGNGKILKPKLRDIAKDLISSKKVQQPEDKHCDDRLTSRL